MKTNLAITTQRTSARFLFLFPGLWVIVLLQLCALQTTLAGSATWDANPTSGDWNTAANWTPETVPNGASDTATFDVSTITAVTTSSDIEANSIVFDANANSYTITPGPSITTPLTLSGSGVINNSLVTQRFISGTDQFGDVGAIYFTGNASAGFRTFFIRNGGLLDQSNGGSLEFYDTSTASQARINCNGGATAGASGGETIFADTSSAGSALIIASSGKSGGGGGTISFLEDSSGGRAQVRLAGNAVLDISSHNDPGVTLGGVNGAGTIFLGAKNLTLNGRPDASFSGTISDGGSGGGSGGSLTLAGTSSVTLSGANTYSGGTILQRNSRLVIANTGGSATGSGPVVLGAEENTVTQIAGEGTITGPLTVGGGASCTFILSSGPFTIQEQLNLFDFSGLYYEPLEESTAISANGVTIRNANIIFEPGFNPASGDVIIAINNTSSTPISGRFNDLPDGTVIDYRGHKYVVSYEGGDGNDLTFTVR